VSYPAGYANVIGVGATTQTNARASFSTYGPHVDIAVPGYQVYSTYWTSSGATYTTMSGTSMAAPFVSGAAAVVWSRTPGRTNAQVADVLLATATDLSAAGRDDEFGAGLLNLGGAVRSASSGYVPAARPARVMAPAVPNASAPVAPGRVVVKLRSEGTARDDSGLLAGTGGSYDRPLLHERTHLIAVPAGQERAVAAALAANPQVEWAEPDYLAKVQ
jgi:subtilisin family serine protease